MSRLFYLLRHGTPETPEGERRYIGTTDLPLSEQGRGEARAWGGWFRTNAGTVGRVCASPLRRAWGTALLVAETAGFPQPAREPGLREIHLGDWEGRPMTEVRENEPELFAARGAHPWRFRTPDGETFEEASLRFRQSLEAISRSTGYKDVLLVSHAGVMRAFLCGLMGCEDKALSLPMPMAGLVILEEDGESWRVLRGPFLPEEFLTEERVEALYRQHKTPDNVVRHMRAVAACAEELLDGRPGFHRERIRKAALLHDLLRGEQGHAGRAAGLLRKEGWDKIAGLVEAHHSGDFDPDAPLSDADILWYADKLAAGDRRVTIEERFRLSREKCVDPEARMRHEQRWRKALDIRRKLERRGCA